MGKVPEETGMPNPYDRQGTGQPFGYTGYRYDGISGSYFAQAREYKPEAGRFTAEDVIKGNGAVPMTLNQYGYCWGNPLILVDNDGKNPLLLPLALLALLGASALLGGCGKQDVEPVEILEWEPIPVTPTPQLTFQPQPTPTLVPTPVPTPERTYFFIKIFIYE